MIAVPPHTYHVPGKPAYATTWRPWVRFYDRSRPLLNGAKRAMCQQCKVRRRLARAFAEVKPGVFAFLCFTCSDELAFDAEVAVGGKR